jgi:hypothetical protein
MATIIPFGTQTVGSATVTLLSFFTNEFNTTYPAPVHKVYVQIDPTSTVQVDIKYATKLIATLWKPPATGQLPEHTLTVGGSFPNAIDMAQITFTGTDASAKVCGYVATA